MSQLGLGVLINEIFGGRKPADDIVEQCVGKTIASVQITEAHEDGTLEVEFTDGYRLELWDADRSCCESRYLHTYHGAELRSIKVEAGPEIETDWEVHEQMFLRVTTSIGPLVVETHNEHNGYYGGFSLTANMVTP